jgi:hypothetical protein
MVQMIHTNRIALGSAFAAVVLPGVLLVAASAAHAVAPPTGVSVNKAQVEYHERVQLANRTRAEIEHDERLLQWLIEQHAR